MSVTVTVGFENRCFRGTQDSALMVGGHKKQYYHHYAICYENAKIAYSVH